MDKRTLLAARIRRVREKIAARRDPCDPECPGWGVFDSDLYGLEICRCDMCFYDMPEDERLTDDEAELLPEAQAALEREKDEARCEESYWARERVLEPEKEAC